MRTRPID